MVNSSAKVVMESAKMDEPAKVVAVAWVVLGHQEVVKKGVTKAEVEVTQT